MTEEYQMKYSRGPYGTREEARRALKEAKADWKEECRVVKGHKNEPKGWYIRVITT